MILMFMVEGVAVDNTACPNPTTNSESVLRSYAQSAMDQTFAASFTVDGVAVQNLLLSYRFRSPAFTFVTPPDNNVLMDREGEPCYSNPAPDAPPWTIPGAVADGVYVMVAPLSAGAHTIHFSAEVGDPNTGFITVEDMTYAVESVLPVVSSSRQGNKLQLSWPKISTNLVLEATSECSELVESQFQRAGSHGSVSSEPPGGKRAPVLPASELNLRAGLRKRVNRSYALSCADADWKVCGTADRKVCVTMTA